MYLVQPIDSPLTQQLLQICAVYGVSPFFASTGTKGAAGRRRLQLRFDSFLELRTFERFAQEQGFRAAAQEIETTEETWILVYPDATLR
jgi:ubiquinone/menaquinone biosynthesis C-methylase UbiE